jgi:excisionase family DNA binding protein
LDRLMTVKEAASYLQLNYMTVYRLIEKGSIPAIRVGGNWRFKKEMVDDWLNKRVQGEKGSVLVIDDDPLIRDLMKEIILQQDFKVSTVENGEEALALLGKESFTLVFLDLVLPGLSGIDVFKAIKEKSNNTLVVIVTGYGDDPVALNAMDLGPLLLMRKPFKDKDITEVLTLANKAKRS